MLKIYNTLTKKKEIFEPIEKNKVKMYSCGPTVYDFFHLGNARTFINVDFIHRYLIYAGYEVTLLINITDVDDKIIKKAVEVNQLPQQIAEHYSRAFFEDLEKLNVKKATLYPKATLHMNDIIEMIKKLIEKGYAYNKDGEVFFKVSKFNSYGSLSGKNIDELIAGARVEVNELKDNPLDFSLWKKAKEGEPYWDSPWGKGRPGWHIECSAMSCKHLGETFDIHAGGTDLIFPHHENEIAQSEAANGQKFVNYWIHFGFLNINEEKMSKSLGNFFTLRDVLKQYNTNAIRLLFAQTHYAAPLNFSDDLLTAADKGCEKIINLYERIIEAEKNSLAQRTIEFNFDEYYKRFSSSMDDDFNLPKAVAVIFDFVREFNRLMDEEKNISFQQLNEAKTFIQKTVGDVLGLVIDKKSESLSGFDDKLIELLLEIRTEAKLAKNFQLADKIRDRLKDIGITIKDGKDKTIYKKH